MQKSIVFGILVVLGFGSAAQGLVVETGFAGKAAARGGDKAVVVDTAVIDTVAVAVIDTVAIAVIDTVAAIEANWKAADTSIVASLATITTASAKVDSAAASMEGVASAAILDTATNATKPAIKVDAGDHTITWAEVRGENKGVSRVQNRASAGKTDSRPGNSTDDRVADKAENRSHERSGRNAELPCAEDRAGAFWVNPGAVSSVTTSASILPRDVPKPRLVVNIVVGQMRYDYLLRFADNFAKGGFRALIKDGVSCNRATHDYLFTSQASGLSTISTGANPSTHGIIGQGWYNYNTSARVDVAQDKGCYAVGADNFDAQVSPNAMVAGGLGDCIKAVSPMSKVVSVAFDPTSAVVMGGFTADAAYWLNPKTGNFISSTYYMQKLPDWVDNFNKMRLIDSYSSAPWTVSQQMKKYHNILSKDIIRDTAVGFFSFDFITRKKGDFKTFSATPWANTLVKDMAVQSIIYENLGKDDTPDLLNIVFDGSRNIGQKYGTLSVELEDSYYRLDKDIENLLSFLETQVGRDRVLVVLSSDHGASDPAIESSRMPHGRFNVAQFSVLINGFLGAKFGDKERWVLDFSNNQLYLNRRAIYENKHNLTQIQNEIAAFAIQFRGVAHAITAASLQSGTAVGIMGKAQNSYYPRHSGDVMINLMPGWMVENDNLSQGGTGYNYDSHVPLVFWGAGLGPGVIQGPVEMRDVAPTTAAVLGIAPPNAATGRAIF